MNRTRVILIWIIGLSFITIGILKYTSLDELTKSVFTRANYPNWMYYAVGTIELTAGVLLLTTATTTKRLGSILVGLLMLGAMGTRYIIHDPPSRFVIPGVIFIVAVLISLDFEKIRKRGNDQASK